MCGRRERLFFCNRLIRKKNPLVEPMNSKAVVQNIERALFMPRFYNVFFPKDFKDGIKVQGKKRGISPSFLCLSFVRYVLVRMYS